MILAALCMVTLSGPLDLESLQARAASSSVGTLPIGLRMEFYARHLLGTPYVGGTLDQDPATERCTVLLGGLDCLTFMETVLALSRTKTPGQTGLVESVTFTRYRGGSLRGYLSRLHYTSDWIFDNCKKGVVTDLTPRLPGAQRFVKPIHFMSANSGAYPALKANPELLPELVRHEQVLTKRAKWYVPKAAVRDAQKLLKTGDIIAITDRREGMDCAHVGIIIVESGIPRFAHASSTLKKVVLDASIADYLDRITSNTGIMVARPTGN